MRLRVLVMVWLITVMGVQSCATVPEGTLLPVRSGVSIACIAYNDAGIRAYEQGQWNMARRSFESAIQASPQSAEAHYNLGKVLHRTGDVGEAVEHFIVAAALAPGDSVIWAAPGVNRRAVEAFKKSHQGHAHSH